VFERAYTRDGSHQVPKQDLVFRKPILNAAGTLGFTPELHAPVDWDSLGAFTTNPISLRPRVPAETPRLIKYPGGLLIHSGVSNPGLRMLLRQCAQSWIHSSVPIVAHLMADRPEETREMVLALEGIENLLAIELSFAPLLADDLILLTVDLSIGEVPIIVSLPADQLLRLGPVVEARGSAAISICPPRGTLLSKGKPVSGRLFGPGLFPLSLERVRSACKLGLTMIGSGGVTTMADADAMLATGALAVELDICLWLPTGKAKSPVC